MDSSEGHSDASDGSGSGRETKGTNRTGSSHDKGPKWACTKATFPDWLWEMEQVWDAVGLHYTYTGQNREDAQRTDSRVRKRYMRRATASSFGVLSDSWKGIPSRQKQ